MPEIMISCEYLKIFKYISLNKTITFLKINYSKAYEVKVLGEEFRMEESRRVF